MKQELRDLKARAARVAERIRQDDSDSPAPAGGFQTRVLSELRQRGPDARLRAIEGALANLIAAIDAYLGN